LESNSRIQKIKKIADEKKRAVLQSFQSNPEKPLQKLVTDATYLPIKGGWCYFSPVIDLFDRSVRAYEIGKTLRIEGNLSLLDQLNTLHLEQDVLLHSDQGVSYTALTYRERLLNSNIQQSMSRRGNCWDNAVIESFFGHMKDELGVSRKLKTNRKH